ncbi:RING finger protein 145-like [Sinocyclocheilus grahami]|nr:PREDICTED: RING finger protein 145-like [Sinocyclocheilus grahami]
MAVKERVEAVLNVGLRVPSIMLLEVLYRWDVSSFFQKIQRSSLNNNPLFQYKYLALYLHYVGATCPLLVVLQYPQDPLLNGGWSPSTVAPTGYILSLVLLTLPRQHLVQLYLYVLTALLLFAGHQISRDYVRSELESGYEGPLYLEPLSINRFTTALICQLVVCTLCSCVMQTKRIWLFSAHLLPLVARLCLVPLETIVFVNRFAMIFTGLEVIYFLASNLLVPFNLAKTAYRELAQVVEVYGLLALGMSLWNQLVLPVLFMCFWLVLFALQIYTYFSTRDQPTSRERLLFLFLTSKIFDELLVNVKCLIDLNLMKVLGTLLIYVLFMVEELRKAPVENMDDVIYWDMTSAVITPCSHLFHAGCLKKWLYVQETCPLCHNQLKGSSQPGSSTQDALPQEPPIQPAGDLDPSTHPESDSTLQVPQQDDTPLTSASDLTAGLKDGGDTTACFSQS